MKKKDNKYKINGFGNLELKIFGFNIKSFYYFLI